ncbi:MAG: PspC domain-containing protein [Propionibacteriaceae bacterium]|jgi:signal transduction histidine kinase/phage shock protein PspC (stress-responsive transcriptional regulator)|nr:PspC domain-containing protein [Propionibacteriaceae bacterium]
MTVHLPENAKTSRPLDEAWLGGVCAGLANQFHWPVLLVRTLAVVILGTSPVGMVLYFVFWLAIPPRVRRKAAGIESAKRAGMSSPMSAVATTSGAQHQDLKPSRRADSPEVFHWHPADLAAGAALAILEIGLLWLIGLYELSVSTEFLIPMIAAAVGLALIWWQADHAVTSKTGEMSGLRRFFFSLAAHWTTIVMVATGLLLLFFSSFLYVTLRVDLDIFPRNVAALLLVLAVVVCSTLPWVIRSRRELNQAVADKLVSETRADIAAHLHDSVLQTLALIQRSANDQRKVVALARRQERELRAYLYGEVQSETTLSEALARCAQDVEDRYGVEVELVNVGDAELDNDLHPLVNASREALVNAAKHSGDKRIDVYTEVAEDLACVFVRDRGRGFDLARIESDRMGVSVSIVERMNRAGGRAIFKTAEGEGTEVRLELPR